MKAEIKTISPEEARRMLQYNVDNFRSIDKARVSRYRQEMEKGQWELNGEAIKFKIADGKKVLLDGQHRLIAITQCKKPVKILIIEGIESDGKYIDRGRPRSVANWIKKNDIPNAVTVAAAAKLIVAHDKGIWNKTINSAAVIDSEIIDQVEKNADKILSCYRLASRAKTIAPVSQLTAILYIGTDGDIEETAHWFTEALAKGIGLSDDDAVYHLRNRLIQAKNPKNRMSAAYGKALMTLAWNKTVQGNQCKVLKLALTGPAKSAMPNEVFKVSDYQ